MDLRPGSSEHHLTIVQRGRRPRSSYQSTKTHHSRNHHTASGIVDHMDTVNHHPKIKSSDCSESPLS